MKEQKKSDSIRQIETARGTAYLFYFDMGADGCKGFVLRDSADRLAITLNSALNESEQALALRHELLHIQLGHTDDGCTLTEQEREAQVLDATKAEMLEAVRGGLISVRAAEAYYMGAGLPVPEEFQGFDRNSYRG